MRIISMNGDRDIPYEQSYITISELNGAFAIKAYFNNQTINLAIYSTYAIAKLAMITIRSSYKQYNSFKLMTEEQKAEYIAQADHDKMSVISGVYRLFKEE